MSQKTSKNKTLIQSLNGIKKSRILVIGLASFFVIALFAFPGSLASAYGSPKGVNMPPSFNSHQAGCPFSAYIWAMTPKTKFLKGILWVQTTLNSSYNEYGSFYYPHFNKTLNAGGIEYTNGESYQVLNAFPFNITISGAGLVLANGTYKFYFPNDDTTIPPELFAWTQLSSGSIVVIWNCNTVSETELQFSNAKPLTIGDQGSCPFQSVSWDVTPNIEFQEDYLWELASYNNSYQAFGSFSYQGSFGVGGVGYTISGEPFMPVLNYYPIMIRISGGEGGSVLPNGEYKFYFPENSTQIPQGWFAWTQTQNEEFVVLWNCATMSEG